MSDLLIELFSEEIPARMQARARDDLKSLITNGLVDAGLTYASAGAFSTPRRLVLSIEGLSAESPNTVQERKGPSLDGPDEAFFGFMRGLAIDAPKDWYKERLEHLRSGGVFESGDLLVRTTEIKGKRVLMAVVKKPGRAAAAIIAEVLESTIRSFPWPKSMRWGSGNLRWVRPLHSILCLLSDEGGAEVVALNIDGIQSANTTAGHRFLSPARFPVTSFDDYAVKLKRAHVVLDSAEREAAIWQGAQNLAFAAGMEVVEDKGLLAEVAGLVEWPVPLMGRIAETFLALPPEVLQTSMREHQKFFSVKNSKTGRIEGFITVANTETADHGETILNGNQKVLSARLSDAKFFWENDLRVAKAEMTEWLEGLKSVTFHNKLGSQSDRIARIAALAREIAPLVKADPDTAEQAAKLAKADLRSAMVGEFPELQGLMGMYYAREAGLPEAVALAARDHYSPLGPTDKVPSDPVSVTVALADKIDTLTGFWAIDEKPTGSKDPFALRRAALGVIRLVIEQRARIVLLPVLKRGIFKNVLSIIETSKLTTAKKIADGLSNFSDGESKADEIVNQTFSAAAGSEDDIFKRFEENESPHLLAFFHDRLKVFLKDQGIRHDVIDACLAMPGNDDLTLLVKRAEALAAFLKTEDGPNLLQGFKRANTLWIQAMEKDGHKDSDTFKKAIEILNEAEAADGVEYSYGPDIKFAETDEERALFAALDTAEAAITPAMRREDFAAAMAAMAQLRAPIDAFFTAVQVNSDNPIIRRNRLNLLHRIRAICSGVADLTKMEG
ncbi:glycine--tRNA ligase subunit beta [Cypionkella sp. TWP1-2-1b2]|uniref:glycine--tRNA ligase subunit beta n=1 Tax=Cypionkella sp. TWP1-2-1b2 TaxID=2804675 RepID=UPI003CF97C99